ncbi:MAG: hypothetical protein JJT87_19320 [Halomonas sp.]|nr:hypothetical protein [Halomonas sp.]MCC5904067.1 hypothetical protein [Halomonas sp.]
MQEQPILPITKQQSRVINDERGSSRYASRRDIDKWLSERKLKRELREVWE